MTDQRLFNAWAFSGELGGERDAAQSAPASEPISHDRRSLGPVPRAARRRRQFSRAHGDQPADLGSEQGLELGAASELQVCRIVQEALANVAWHSIAGQAILTIDKTSQGIEFLNEDDGGQWWSTMHKLRLQPLRSGHSKS